MQITDRDYQRAKIFRKLKKFLWLSFLLFPPALILITFIFLPMASALWYSVYEWNGLIRGEFIGLDNFRKVLLDPERNWFFFNALKNNILVFVSLMVIQNGTALVIALFLAREPKGARIYQVVFFLPVILSTVIIGFQWKMFLNPVFGLVNKLLNAIGLNDWALPWLGLPETALPTMILVN